MSDFVNDWAGESTSGIENRFPTHEAAKPYERMSLKDSVIPGKLFCLSHKPLTGEVKYFGWTWPRHGTNALQRERAGKVHWVPLKGTAKRFRDLRIAGAFAEFIAAKEGIPVSEIVVCEMRDTTIDRPSLPQPQVEEKTESVGRVAIQWLTTYSGTGGTRR